MRWRNFCIGFFIKQILKSELSSTFFVKVQSLALKASPKRNLSLHGPVETHESKTFYILVAKKYFLLNFLRKSPKKDLFDVPINYVNLKSLIYLYTWVLKNFENSKSLFKVSRYWDSSFWFQHQRFSIGFIWQIFRKRLCLELECHFEVFQTESINPKNSLRRTNKKLE